MSELNLHNEQSATAIQNRAVSLVEREAKILTDTNRALLDHSKTIEKHLALVGKAADAMKAHLEVEGVLSTLNRRDVPGLTIRGFEKDLRPWLFEYVSWRLGVQINSDFRVFQPDRPLADVIARDQQRIDEEANNLICRAQRGW